MILQVADVGINLFLKNWYCKEYTASMCATSVTGAVFDDAERLMCIVRTVAQLRCPNNLVSKCFLNCGLLSGYAFMYSHFPTSSFNTSIALVDDDLPKIDPGYIEDVLLLVNLSAAPGSKVEISTLSITERQQTLKKYYNGGEGFRQFFSPWAPQLSWKKSRKRKPEMIL